MCCTGKRLCQTVSVLPGWLSIYQIRVEQTLWFLIPGHVKLQKFCRLLTDPCEAIFMMAPCMADRVLCQPKGETRTMHGHRKKLQIGCQI